MSPQQTIILLSLAGLGLVWLFMSASGGQARAVAWIGISTIPQRLGQTSVVVVGIAGVVGVLVALQAMAAGFEASLKAAGRDDRAIILRAAANSEMASALDRPATTMISQADGIALDSAGNPLVSIELLQVASLKKRSNGADANLQVRGVGPGAWALRPQVRIIAGRGFSPGKYELIVGQGAVRQLQGLELGRSIHLNGQSWRIVGLFASGDTHESEAWGDAETLAAAGRRNGFQSVTVALSDPNELERLRTGLAADPRLRVDVETTRAYFSKQSERLSKVLRVIGTGVAIIMALGAVFGALNTMYAAVASRAREIATLRAIGFPALPVVVAIMMETMILAAAGGALGAGIAWALFNGFTVSTLGSNFSQVVFQFQVTGTLILRGFAWALSIGFIGGLLPALKAATLPVTIALRES